MFPLMPVSRLDIAVDKAGLLIPGDGNIAVFRASADWDYGLISGTELHLFNSFRPHYDNLAVLGHSLPETIGQDYGMVLVHVTRSKVETLGLIARALKQTRPGGVVVVDGGRTDGIDSVQKQLKSVLPLAGSLAKFHGRLFWISRPKSLPDMIQTWLSGLIPRQNEDGFLTAAGMFSPDHIDLGSALLAGQFDGRLKGLVADLGAGWGWLAARALAVGNIKRIDLYEAESTALDAAKANLAGASAEFHWSDVPNLSTEIRYDAVITNPPFHQGRAATPALGLEFIKKAAKILKPSGALWLVANRQLPYEADLSQHFRHWQILNETDQFKVVLATKPFANSSRKRTAKFIKSR